jgi:predicted DCC family thiol-disulfide oxidoreductase YuxK
MSHPAWRGPPRDYLPSMTDDDTRILYNDTCPLCRFEIDHYRAAATRDGSQLCFDRLEDAASWGLTEDQAARRLHVLQDGQLLSGLDAFRAIWSTLPRWRWAARLTGLPVLKPLVAVLYNRIAAPLLYRAHLRRQARRMPPKA